VFNPIKLFLLGILCSPEYHVVSLLAKCYQTTGFNSAYYEEQSKHFTKIKLIIWHHGELPTSLQHLLLFG